MDLIERVRRNEFLGKDFLVWLWFRSETDDGVFDLGEMGKAELRVDRKVTLESEDQEEGETITCSGDNPQLREARFALTKNKKVSQAQIRLIMDDNEWSFILDSTWMNFKSLKTPKVVQDTKYDPEGLFYEKMLLIEQPLAVINAVFLSFIKLRVSPEWKTDELPALIKWINEGK